MLGTLYVSPVVFEQLWETADAPENEQPTVQIKSLVISYVDPPHVGLDVYEVALKPRSRPHPGRELQQRYWPVIVGMLRGIEWLVAGLLIIELIRLFWR